MTTSLNDRFKTFLNLLPFAEAIDNLELPPEFDDSKRADFLIDNRKAIIELKSLESDPEHKIHSELENHQDRDEYPLFYGELELSNILKHLPDGEKIQKKLLYKISRSIEQAFRKADKQIRATKDIFNCPGSIGLLVLLNEDISVLSPEIISYRVSQLLTKTENDGDPHYRNITSVWFISENFTLKTKKGHKLIPSIVIDGPSAAGKPELANILNNLQSNWAAFNGVPYVIGEAKKITDSNFIRLSELEKEDQDRMPRHELWRKQYRNNRYLNSLSDEAVLSHGARLLSFMTPHFLKGGHKLPFEQVAQFMEGWTHFLEEAKIRGIITIINDVFRSKKSATRPKSSGKKNPPEMAISGRKMLHW